MAVVRWLGASVLCGALGASSGCDDPASTGRLQQEVALDGVKLTRYTLVSEAETSGQHTGDSSTICKAGLGGACYHKEFLCSGYGVAMQGTGIASDGKIIRYISGGGGWTSGYVWLNDCEGANFSVTDAARGASGRVLSADWSIAVDPALIALGSYVWIDSQNHWYRADDTGGAIDGAHIDVFMADTGWTLGSASSDVFVADSSQFRGHGAPSPYEQEAECTSIGASGTVIDDSSPCFSVGGNHLGWHAERYGHQDSLSWINTGSDDNVGTWALRFDQGGEYDLEVFLEEKFGRTQRARYRIRHAGGTDEIEVDQTAQQGFVALGRFAFDGGIDYSVELSGDTGESEQTTVAFDALRVSPAGSGPAPDPDPDPDPDGDPVDPESSGGQLVGGCHVVATSSGPLPWLLIVLAFARGRWSRRHRSEQV